MTRTMLTVPMLALCSLALGCKSKTDAGKRAKAAGPETEASAGQKLERSQLNGAEGPPCQFDAQTPDFADTDGCPTWLCGSNSPIVGAEEYDLSGKAGTYVIVGLNGAAGPTIQRGSTPNGPDEIRALKIKAGAFVAGDLPIDEKQAKRGWWFKLKERDGKNTCVVNIADVDSIAPWTGGEPLPAYTLKVDRGDGRKALCRKSLPWGKWRPAHGKQEASDAALLVAQERYLRPEVEIAAESGNENANWFNIACAGSALAKMRLMGFDPEADVENTHRKDRQTVLKMLTGRYCQAGSTPWDWTLPGVPLGVSKCQDGSCSLDLAPEGTKAAIREAYWNENGATCLDHSRLFSSMSYRKDDKGETRPRLNPNCHGGRNRANNCEGTIRTLCNLKACKKSDATPWATKAIDHEEH